MNSSRIFVHSDDDLATRFARVNLIVRLLELLVRDDRVEDRLPAFLLDEVGDTSQVLSAGLNEEPLGILNRLALRFGRVRVDTGSQLPGRLLNYETRLTRRKRSSRCPSGWTSPSQCHARCSRRYGRPSRGVGRGRPSYSRGTPRRHRSCSHQQPPLHRSQ